MKPVVSIILPTYNEAGNIDKLILTLIKTFKHSDFKLEFIVVDDHSPDGTATVVKKLISRQLPVKLFIRTKQRGLATAILFGIRHSSGKIIVLMDTDFNHQPKDALRLVQTLISSSADLVIGSRYIAKGGMHRSEAGIFQFLGSKWGNFIVNKIILRLPVHESLSGFIALKKSLLKKLALPVIFQGYGDYCIRLLYHAHKQQYILTEIPVFYGKRQYGVSKSHLVKMFVGYFKTALSLRLMA